MSNNLIILLLIILASTSCKEREAAASNSVDDIYDYKKYDRFILAKSRQLFMSAAKISDFGHLPGEGNVNDHEFSFADLPGWEVIKVSDELDEMYFYNIAYWLLGFGPEDSNCADEVVIVLQDKQTSEIKYLGLIDSEISGIDDSMLLISDSGEQYMIDIPFHTYTQIEKKYNYSIPRFLEADGIGKEVLIDMTFDKILIRFNEKASR